MPVHDWTRVEAGIFHDFHTVWIGHLRTALNEGLLPKGYYALVEQHAGHTITDVLTLHASPVPVDGGVAGFRGRLFSPKPRSSRSLRNCLKERLQHELLTLLTAILMSKIERELLARAVHQHFADPHHIHADQSVERDSRSQFHHHERWV